MHVHVPIARNYEYQTRIYVQQPYTDSALLQVIVVLYGRSMIRVLTHRLGGPCVGCVRALRRTSEYSNTMGDTVDRILLSRVSGIVVLIIAYTPEYILRQGNIALRTKCGSKNWGMYTKVLVVIVYRS